MRFSISLKNVSLGLAILSLSAAAASAQSLSGVNTKLLTPLNSQTAKVGQAVAVKLDQSVKITSGQTLPKGTELLGTISEVKAAQGRTPASVAVVFTTAQLKDGNKIPVKATLLGATPPAGGLNTDESKMAPAQVDQRYAVDQEPGALPGVALKASVQDPASGTFSKDNGNFKLATGSNLQVGVGPASAAGATSAAE